jgi:hypothetical protein
LNITKFGKNKSSNLQKQDSKQPTKVWKRKNYRYKTNINAQIWILHNMKKKKLINAQICKSRAVNSQQESGKEKITKGGARW